MARSKRNKIGIINILSCYLICSTLFRRLLPSVSLTKTDRKGRNLKSKLVDALRDTLDEYKAVYLFSFENMRTEKFKEVRMYFRESRYPSPC